MSSSNSSFFLYTWIMALMGTSSSYAHLKLQAPIPSLITLGFWLQWAPSNFFKLYTLEAFSLRHNDTLSSFQDLSNTTQALMNTKVHSKICKLNECTHKLSLRTNTQEKIWLRVSFFVLQMIPHTLFIEWDFGYYSRHCSLDVLLFMTLLLAFYCTLAVGTIHDTVH